MQLVLTEEQASLSRTANDFILSSPPIARLRKLRDTRDERGYALDRLARMAELGWTAIPFPEQDGGLGMGLAELVLVTEAMGKGLAPEPFIPSIVLAGRAIALGGSAEHKASWLRPAIAGEKVLALAHTRRRGRFDRTRMPVHAAPEGQSFRLTGQATQVWGGHLADGYVVAARTAGRDGDRDGITLFLVPAQARGVTSERQYRVDAQNAAQLTFDNVLARGADVLGQVGEGDRLLDRVVDEATVALTGEMLGGMSEAFDRTLRYVRERRQFGVAIGSFQALKHRAARLYIELELSRSAVMAAARALDAQSPEAPRLVSLAKARLSDAYCLVANEAVQMHGGIGMTDEHDIGFFLKRARASEMTFGDAAYHRDRFATLDGY
ncbi:MAG TPA: acyl-CoA dehydrogenase family protein [Kofleriaceae bacterium]|jgi:alkylation response protein AidB-like acyl-CoA dehydrogenase|nr:acyl-CoA dehydrogenase family protein [Kofleriaceae bacterium]